jgi:hypothetical protein
MSIAVEFERFILAAEHMGEGIMPVITGEVKLNLRVVLSGGNS